MTETLPWGPLTVDEERELRARWSEFLDAVDPNYHPTGVVPRLLATLDAARFESPSPCRYCGSVSGETPPGAWQTDPLTGDALRRSINAACSLTNPRLSEVDWDAVAALARSQSPSPEGLTEAWAEAEAALPEGWVLVQLERTYRLSKTKPRRLVEGYWMAKAHPAETPESEFGLGDTPPAALRALAARLRSSADSGPEGT